MIVASWLCGGWGCVVGGFSLDGEEMSALRGALVGVSDGLVAVVVPPAPGVGVLGVLTTAEAASEFAGAGTDRVRAAGEWSERTAIRVGEVTGRSQDNDSEWASEFIQTLTSDRDTYQ